MPTDHGIGTDVQLTITTPHGPLLDLPLVQAAIIARARDGQILPFLYRVPVNPEAPDEPRPLRRAILAITDDTIVPEGTTDGH